MSRRMVIDCDQCGRPGLTAAVQFEVWTGRAVDSAGSPEDRTVRVDLCGECAGRACAELIAGLNADQRGHWLARLRPGPVPGEVARAVRAPAS